LFPARSTATTQNEYFLFAAATGQYHACALPTARTLRPAVALIFAMPWSS